VVDPSGSDVGDTEARLGRQARGELIRITTHAHQEMVEDDVRLDDLLCALRRATVIENYPHHQRGPCCLVYGRSCAGRDLHVVCTTSLDVAIVITVYEPTLPKWRDPYTRERLR
jgi:hypothetical protein